MRPALPPSGTYRFISILLLIGAGVYWLGLFGPKTLSSFQRYEILAAAVLAFVPGVSRWIDQTAQVCNRALEEHAGWTGLAVGIVVCGYLLAFAYFSHDRLFLKLNDEHAYMIQARMLAHGRLWMHAYPPQVAPFFDALAMVVDRVYAPMYFPGTALAMTPFVWVGLDFWWMTVLAAAVAAGLLYVVIAEVFDPFRGLLSVILLISLGVYRDTSIALLAETPFLAAEMVLILGWLRFHARPRTRWAIVIGAAAGYLAITRPLDAVCCALPVGAAILWQLRREPNVLMRRGAVIVLAAAPFLLLLLVQNIGVTGHWWETAEGYFNRHNFPASPMGFHTIEADQIPANLNAVKRQWLQRWVLPSFERHTVSNAVRTWYRGRLVQLLDSALPNPILLLLLPVGFLAIREARRVVIVVPLVLFCVGYAIYLFFLEHYVVSILPAMIVLVLLGWEGLNRVWPGGRVNALITLELLVVSISVLWPVVSLPPLPNPYAPDQKNLSKLLAELPKTPAVVLFRFDPAVGEFHDDPVYNDAVAWPDDAVVVRARDLGADKDRDIDHYYVARQPGRVFYIYDPDERAAGRDPISGPLGTARELDGRGW